MTKDFKMIITNKSKRYFQIKENLFLILYYIVDFLQLQQYFSRLSCAYVHTLCSYVRILHVICNEEGVENFGLISQILVHLHVRIKKIEVFLLHTLRAQ